MAVRCFMARRIVDSVRRRRRDTRQPGQLRHPVVDMPRQRVFGIALGYEDVCRYVDKRSNLCQTYDERPPVCRVADMYARFRGRLAWPDFVELNLRACEALCARVQQEGD